MSLFDVALVLLAGVALCYAGIGAMVWIGRLAGRRTPDGEPPRGVCFSQPTRPQPPALGSDDLVIIEAYPARWTPPPPGWERLN